jgi:hypothetical protein
MYPSLSDILWVPASKLLAKVDPEIAMGHTYNVNDKESCCTTGEQKPGFAEYK